MLEIRYDINTKVLSAWCASEARFGHLDRGRENEAVAIIDSGIPDKPPMAWLYKDNKLKANPDYKEPAPEQPPCSIHIAKIVSIDISRVRPVEIEREWLGNITRHDCLVTENLKDQYLQGDIHVGDYMLVDCQTDHICEYIIIAKIFKSW